LLESRALDIWGRAEPGYQEVKPEARGSVEAGFDVRDGRHPTALVAKHGRP
jgi:hypothetical protein